MKILNKMILGFSVIILSIWVVEFFAVDISKKALKKSIEKSSVSLAVQTIDELDKNIFRRIEETQLYSKDLRLQKTVLESNREFAKLDDIQAYINKKDLEWTSAPKESITTFMQKIINNVLSNDLREKINYFRNKYGYDVFSELLVTNKYGANVAQTGKTTDYSHDDEKWWQTAKNERFYIRDIGYAESVDVYSIDFGIIIEDEEGNFIGVIKAVVNIQELINVIKGPEPTETLKEQTTVGRMLITKDGRIIYSPGDFEFLGKVSDEFLSHFKKDRTGSFIAEVSTKEKGEKLFSYARSNFRGLEWIFILEHETKEIFAPITKLRNGILTISMAITIFAILTSLLFSRSITKPVTKLRDAAIRIGKGNLDTKIDVKSKDEIGLFAKTFSQMAANLNRDITERKQAEEALRDSEHSYKTLAENLPGIVYRVFIRENARVTLFNKLGQELTGYKDEELKEGEVCAMESKILQEDRPKVIAKVLHATLNHVPFTVEYRFIRKDGSIRYFLEKGTPLYGKDGNPLYIDGVIFDITEYKQAEMELKRLATIDYLTGVFNRTTFKELIEREIERAQRYNKPLSMIMFDIDHFKKVNDTYGHSVGDYVLKTLAKIVREAIRKIDYLVRWGGEEFLIILPENNLDKAQTLAERIRQIIEHYTFDNVGKVTVSLGVAEFKEGDTEDTLINNSDSAMLKAKRKGRNRVEVHI
jgi:diguanylate cyclase (GGDEF)-like protein/PAS domain S-box-containing protein